MRIDVLREIRALLHDCGIVPEGKDPADGGGDLLKDIQRVRAYVAELQNVASRAVSS